MLRIAFSKVYPGILGLLVVALSWGPGCQEAKPPPSPEALVFTREVQAIINRIAPPLVGPVDRKDQAAVQKALVKAFSLCAQECEGVFYNVFILDQSAVLTAIYPPAEVKRIQFSDYKAVEKAFKEKKPNQTILYQPDGTPTYIISVPLVQEGKVTGILALSFEGNQVRDKRGVSEQEFLTLNFETP